MKVRHIRITNFRGFESLSFAPRDHVLLVGQPGAGRSDLVEAVWRVLTPESSRFPLTEDLDFFKRDLSRRIEVEVVLGELGTHLEQAFLDRLELWDQQTSQLVEELDGDAGDGGDALEQVVRLCYRALWDPDQQVARHWVDFPKFSDPEADDYRSVPRELREELPVAFVASGGSPVSLGSRSDLRRLVEGREENDFATALNELMGGIEGLAEKLLESKDLTTALEQVVDPLRIPLGLGQRAADDVIRFALEGGSLSGVLRGLQPTLKLRDELGYLPLARHGSTLANLLQLSLAVARSEREGAIVVVDDFGDGIDADSAQHLAATLRRRAGQLWMSTRMGIVGSCFRPQELARLSVSEEGVRGVHLGRIPQSKAERIAARHLHLQILPAVSSRSVVIVEGPHDRVALSAAIARLNTDAEVPLPAASRISLVDAASAEGSGGIGAIPRLATLARNLGFHVVAVIDWDRDETVATARLEQNLRAADAVVRWPERCAIERAVLSGLDDEIVQAAIRDVSAALEVVLDYDPMILTGNDLHAKATRFLKSAGGLHGPLVDALPLASARLYFANVWMKFAGPSGRPG